MAERVEEGFGKIDADESCTLALNMVWHVWTLNEFLMFGA